MLSEEKLITAEVLIKYLPNIRKRNLPALRNNGEDSNLQEREILYKLLFEMKNDLNDLKSLVFELISNNDLTVSDIRSLRELKSPRFDRASESSRTFETESPRYFNEREEDSEDPNRHPIIIEKGHTKPYSKMEVVEENLSLEEMEKDMINKALKKHKGRRKDAAEELGISERTLYRKIKQYEL